MIYYKSSVISPLIYSFLLKWNKWRILIINTLEQPTDTFIHQKPSKFQELSRKLKYDLKSVQSIDSCHETSSDRFNQCKYEIDNISQLNERKPFTNADSNLNTSLRNNNYSSPQLEHNPPEPVKGTIFINDPSKIVQPKHSQRYSWNIDTEDKLSHQEIQQSPEIQKSIVYATPFWEMEYLEGSEWRVKSPFMSEENSKTIIFNEPTFAWDQPNLSQNMMEKESVCSENPIKERKLETLGLGMK